MLPMQFERGMKKGAKTMTPDLSGALIISASIIGVGIILGSLLIMLGLFNVADVIRGGYEEGYEDNDS